MQHSTRNLVTVSGILSRCPTTPSGDGVISAATPFARFTDSRLCVLLLICCASNILISTI